MTLQILKAGVLYFAFVFGAGFVLGIIRTLWVVPRVGTRMAELRLRVEKLIREHFGCVGHGVYLLKLGLITVARFPRTLPETHQTGENVDGGSWRKSNDRESLAQTPTA